MTKPTSKVIQISATSTHFIFLCQDGSSWAFSPTEEKWQCILKAVRNEDPTVRKS